MECASALKVYVGFPVTLAAKRMKKVKTLFQMHSHGKNVFKLHQTDVPGLDYFLQIVKSSMCRCTLQRPRIDIGLCRCSSCNKVFGGLQSIPQKRDHVVLSEVFQKTYSRVMQVQPYARI